MAKIQYNFENRTALITGGAQGFGLDIAKRFLNSGAKVIIWDIDEKLLDKTKKDIIALGFNSEDVNRVIDLIDFNEYKRRQVPLGIKISSRNFGKDRRYPITNFWKNHI